MDDDVHSDILNLKQAIAGANGIVNDDGSPSLFGYLFTQSTLKAISPKLIKTLITIG